MLRVAYVEGAIPAALLGGDPYRGLRISVRRRRLRSAGGGRWAPFDKEPHLARLARSLSEVQIAAPISHAALRIVMREPYSFIERPFTVEATKAASAAFLTGTTVDPLPVVRIDGGPVGRGAPGSLSRRLRECCLADVTEAM